MDKIHNASIKDKIIRELNKYYPTLLSYPPHGMVMPMGRSMSVVPGYSEIKGMA